MSEQVSFSLLVYVIMLLMLGFSKFHKSVVTMTAGVIFLTSRYVNMSDVTRTCFVSLDFITMLLGMSILASFIKRSGIFQFLVLKAVRKSGFKLNKLIGFICLAVFALSAIFCDRASVVLIFPIIAFIFDSLNLEFNPILLGILNSSSAGGVLLCISGAEVMLVSSFADLDFFNYLITVTPAVAVSFLIYILMSNRIYVKGEIDTSSVSMIKFNEEMALSGPNLFSKIILILVFMVFLLCISGVTGIADPVIVLSAAVLLFLLTEVPPDQILSDIKLNLFLYIFGLQITATAFVKYHIFDSVSAFLLYYIDLKSFFMAFLILLAGTIFSVIFGRLSTVFFFIPLIASLAGKEAPPAPLCAALIFSMTFARAPTMLREIPKVLKNTHINEKEVWSRYFQFIKDSAPIYLANFLWLSAYLQLRFYCR